MTAVAPDAVLEAQDDGVDEADGRTMKDCACCAMPMARARPRMSKGRGRLPDVVVQRAAERSRSFSSPPLLRLLDQLTP